MNRTPAARPAPHDAAASPRPAPSRPRRRATIKSPKARTADTCQQLEQLPNIGPALAADLRRLGIQRPGDLKHADGHTLYRRLCELTGRRQDPCVLDTFLAVTDFMRGAAPAPWWAYTAQRKLQFGDL